MIVGGFSSDQNFLLYNVQKTSNLYEIQCYVTFQILVRYRNKKYHRNSDKNLRDFSFRDFSVKRTY